MLSACWLIGAYFLAVSSHKRGRLNTSVYGTSLDHDISVVYVQLNTTKPRIPHVRTIITLTLLPHHLIWIFNTLSAHNINGSYYAWFNIFTVLIMHGLTTSRDCSDPSGVGRS